MRYASLKRERRQPFSFDNELINHFNLEVSSGIKNNILTPLEINDSSDVLVRIMNSREQRFDF